MQHKATCPTAEATHLVNHIRQQTLHFVTLHGLLAAQVDAGMELINRDPGTSSWWLGGISRFFETAGDVDFAEEVAECDVAATLQGQINAALDEFLLTSGEGSVKASQVAALDTAAEGEEETLELRERGQESFAGLSVVSNQMARDQVGEDESAWCQLMFVAR